MRKKSSEYKSWKKHHDEKQLEIRTRCKDEKKHPSKKKKRLRKRRKKIIQRPTKEFIVPKVFSIIKNPEETIEFLNHIIKCVESVRYLLKNKNVKFVRLYYINMENTEVVTSDALMYLLTIISNTRGTKLLPISWKGNLPIKNEVKDYIRKSGYLKYMNTSSENIVETDENIQIKNGVGYTYGPDNFDIRKEIIDFTCSKLNKDKIEVNFLMTMLTEMISNISDHAYQKEGLFKHEWYIFVSNENDKIIYTFMDNGLGIPTTIRKSIKEHIIEFFNAEEEFKYIETAVNGVAKRSETGQIERGNGLPEIYNQFVAHNIENFGIISNKAFFNDKIKRDMNQELKGTVFYWEIKKEVINNDN